MLVYEVDMAVGLLVESPAEPRSHFRRAAVPREVVQILLGCFRSMLSLPFATELQGGVVRGRPGISCRLFGLFYCAMDRLRIWLLFLVR